MKLPALSYGATTLLLKGCFKNWHVLPCIEGTNLRHTTQRIAGQLK